MKSILTGVCIVVFTTGCANLLKYRPYARNVKKSSKGGVVALKVDHRPEDQDLAKSYMASTCGGKKYRVVEEKEVKVGEIVKSRSESERGTRSKSKLFGIPVSSGHDGATSSQQETLAKKEWHILYKCT